MRRFLLVDDSALARRAARTVLVQQGIVPVEASSVVQALTLISPVPDAALLDLELGDGSGVVVADALLATGGPCRIAFITASDDEAKLEDARRRAPVFAKPAGIASAIALLLSDASARRG
jgi:CheY-like chemotaxis protein